LDEIARNQASTYNIRISVLKKNDIPNPAGIPEYGKLQVPYLIREYTISKKDVVPKTTNNFSILKFI